MGPCRTRTAPPSLPADASRTPATGSTARTGEAVTSTYYRDHLEDWVEEFNKEKRADHYFGKDWTRLPPDLDYETQRAGRRARRGPATAARARAYLPSSDGRRAKAPVKEYYESCIVLRSATSCCWTSSSGRWRPRSSARRCAGPSVRQFLLHRPGRPRLGPRFAGGAGRDAASRPDREGPAGGLDARSARAVICWCCRRTTASARCRRRPPARARRRPGCRPELLKGKAELFLQGKFGPAAGKPSRGKWIEATAGPWIYEPEDRPGTRREQADVEGALADWLRTAKGRPEAV